MGELGGGTPLKIVQELGVEQENCHPGIHACAHARARTHTHTQPSIKDEGESRSWPIGESHRVPAFRRTAATSPGHNQPKATLQGRRPHSFVHMASYLGAPVDRTQLKGKEQGSSCTNVINQVSFLGQRRQTLMLEGKMEKIWYSIVSCLESLLKYAGNSEIYHNK